MIICPLCRFEKDENGEEKIVEFDNWKQYAQHILDDHPEDKERCMWAEDALAAEDETIIESPEPARFMGKPIEKVPVSRRASLPPIMKRALEMEDNKHKGKVENAGNNPEGKKTRGKKVKEDTSP
jgi:hypothetical protein